MIGLKRYILPLILLFVWILSTVAKGTPKLSCEGKTGDSAKLEGEILWLHQSLFAGQFYDDDRYVLVHPRRFNNLSYLKNAEGEIIQPPPAQSIIP